jgi:hypothetical protein
VSQERVPNLWIAEGRRVSTARRRLQRAMADDEDDTTPDDDDGSEKHPLTQAKNPFGSDDAGDGDDGADWQPPVP